MGKRPTILIVDNEPHTQQELTQMLRRQGYQTLTAHNGQAALLLAEQQPSDLILLSVSLPDMDGYTVGQQIKAVPANQNIPIIFLGESLDLDFRIQVFAAGGADYLLKPLLLPEVQTRLSYQLQLRQQQQQLSQEVRKRQTITAALDQKNQQLQQQIAQEALLGQITQRIYQSLDLNTILTTAVDEVQQLLAADRVLTYQFNPDWSGQASHEAVSKPELSVLNSLIQDECFTTDLTQAFAAGRISRISNLRTAAHITECHRLFLQQFQVQANLVVPIVQRLDQQQDELWGLLIAHQCSSPRHWTDGEVKLMQRLAAQLAVAIQQSQLFERTCQQAQQEALLNEQLSRLANLDGLTQVANRRRFDKYFQTEWQRLRREQKPLSLLLLDVDDFKAYNDTYGHLQGDDCLVQIARILSSVTKRPADLVARYGGEEFALVLPYTDATGAKQLADTVLQALADQKIPHASSRIADRITASIGIATTIPDVIATPNQLLHRADLALYQAKSKGRNCCVVWHPETAPVLIGDGST